MLLRLAYLTVTNTFAVLRLLPMSDRDKDAEILALRHQITVLERQLGGGKVRFSPNDRAFLAALLHRLPSQVPRRIRLVVRPDTVLRRHRDPVARRHAARCRPKRPGRPRTVRSIGLLVLRLARENSTWGYRRIHGELLVLGVTVAASTVWEILQEGRDRPGTRARHEHMGGFPALPGRRPAGMRLPGNDHLVWGAVLCVCGDRARQPPDPGPRRHRASHRILVTQVVKNLVMDLEDADCRAKFLIRDRDGKFPALSDTVLNVAGIEVVLSGVRMPRMNSIMERWVQTCRHELLDRTLIWNQRHLLHALREFEDFYNSHRPHQGITNARPLRPLPMPISDPEQITRLGIRRRQRLGGILHEYRHAA